MGRKFNDRPNIPLSMPPPPTNFEKINNTTEVFKLRQQLNLVLNTKICLKPIKE